MIASAPWVVVLVGVAVLAVLLVVALLSFRGPESPSAWSPGPPVSLPTAGQGGESTPTARSTASTGPSASATSTASVSPTGSPSRSGSPEPPTDPSGTGSVVRPDASRSPSASAPAAPADEGGAVTASYRVQDSDDADHFEAQLVVRNGTSRSEDWQVELRFSGGVTGIRASSGPGVSVTIRGSGWYLLSGTGQLAAGAQQSVQLRFTRTGGGEYPTQCTVNGSGCGMG
ncbi:cellulose binding domain-containing protein [Micromonospora sp. C95]|uniref:cellulose binding domain-containing protein n=1 Tax=Micromonospora sp. C95 TaxID=2824882 RepID=UPI001B358BB2|nr:cellulose binding domain-containing protein [Micromonospora sp. C95]MBQ1025810.1 cellulose binding domain-containing protein [Micromonospora sp. C95]